jgi:4-diphosphocytidyl-2-C-methyl-D-erythritol kinase
VSNRPFSLPSFAKINWALRILGRRADGYHEIRTILQTISLHDDLRFSPHGDGKIQLTCDDPRIPTDEGNLIVRAAQALRDRFQVSAGAAIHLEKRIPTKGGLGGASSNAAVAFLGLAHLWSLDVATEELIELGAQLGADVPFFFVGGRTLATGIGTALMPISDSLRQHLLVVTPNAAVSTADAYKALRSPALTSLVDASILSISRGAAEFQDSEPGVLHNDFERVIFEIEPEIERAQIALIRSGASKALLAGSGSSVFGIFDNREAQERALQEIRAEAGWRLFAAVTVPRHEYLEALSSGGDFLLHSSNLKSDAGA